MTSKKVIEANQRVFERTMMTLDERFFPHDESGQSMRHHELIDCKIYELACFLEGILLPTEVRSEMASALQNVRSLAHRACSNDDLYKQRLSEAEALCQKEER